MEPMMSLLLLPAGFILTRVILPFLLQLLADGGAVKVNWQGKKIPGLGGLVLPFVFGIVVTLLAAVSLLDEEWRIYLLAVYGISLVGLLDDLVGNNRQKGIKGHFMRLFREKKLTTGAIKALAAGLIALIAVVSLAPHGGSAEKGLFSWTVDWLLVVTSVNTINLFDLRPGRAVKAAAFFLLFVLINLPREPGLALCTLGILLAYGPYDFRGLVMLGDTGSNTLGVITGLALLQAPLGARLAVLGSLLVLNIMAEKISLSRIIERNTWLRLIDNWGQKNS